MPNLTGVKGAYVAFGLTVALLIGGVLAALVAAGGCMENVYEDTLRGDVCGKVAFHGRGWFVVAFAPAAVYLTLVTCWKWARARPGVTALLVLGAALAVDTFVLAAVTSNL